MGGGAKILKGSDIARIFPPGAIFLGIFERGANLLGGGRKSCDNGMGK